MRKKKKGWDEKGWSTKKDRQTETQTDRRTSENLAGVLYNFTSLLLAVPQLLPSWEPHRQLGK